MTDSAHPPARPRVLHVIASMSPASGGPTTAMWNTLAALERRGIHAELVTTLDRGSSEASASGGRHTPGCSAGRVHFFPRQTTLYTASWPLWRWIEVHASRFDIVHAHGLFSFAPVVAAFIARRRRIPYVIRPAGVLNRWGRSQRRPLLKRAALRWLDGPLLRDAARIQFTTPEELEQARELGLALRSAVIPIGLDTDELLAEHPAAAACADLQDAAGRLVVLFLSRIDRIKRLDMLIRAFAEIVRRRPDALLVVAGEGPAEFVAQQKRLAESLRIQNHIRWLGFVDPDRKRALLRASDILVLPSHSENFGVAVVEAMAARLPVVVSAGVGIAWLVARSECGLVFDEGLRPLAHSIEQLLADPALRQRMGAAGERAVQSELTLDIYGRRLEELYAQILQDPPAAPAG